MAAISHTVAEDVAVPVHDAALPGRLGEELGRALGEPQAGIRDNQPQAGEPALLEVLEERAPARFVLLGALSDAEPALFEPIATSRDTLRTSPAQLRLSTIPSRYTQ
jgi:hypothetical protein